MKKIKPVLLIAGGGYADIPLIQAGQSLGYHVVTSGNNPKDLGHKYADETQLADFSDPEEMLNLAKSLNINAICSSCNDFSALSTAYVAEQLGLPGHDTLSTSQLIHHKDLYRNFALKNQINTPLATGFDSIDTALDSIKTITYPSIVKPVDLTGGKGICKVTNHAEARIAVRDAFRQSKAKRIVIEEFIEGSRHGISTLLRDGKVVFYAHDDEYYYTNPYLVSAASSPGEISEYVVNEINQTVERIAKLLNLVSGIVHIQFIINEYGSPVIIEMCRRAPGDLYVNLVKYSTGIDYPSYIVKASCGLDFNDLSQTNCQKYITRHCIMSPRSGVIKEVSINPTIQNQIIDLHVWWKAGDIVSEPMTHKLGIVFIEFSSFEEMQYKSKIMPDLIKVILE